MKTQIHELITRIDGISQLVKSLDKPTLIIENPFRPYMSQEELLQQMKLPGIIMLDKPESKIEYIGPGLSFLAESYKSLLLAKAWLGKVLAELGEETPYKNDGNRKPVEDIEPTADKSSGKGLFKDDFELLWWKNELTYIEKIDWLREEIQKLIIPIIRYTNEEEWLGLFVTKSYEYLSEARFHLGFELSRLKEQSKRV